MRDGRSFQVVNKPLAQGGWVATIEDITERRKLEQERDRNYAFLQRDHRSHPVADHGEGRARSPLSAGQPRAAEAQFGMPRDHIVGKTALDLFPKAAADDHHRRRREDAAIPDGLFKDEHVWESQARGTRYITSTRIGIRDKSGEPATSSTSSTMSPSAGAPTKRSRISRITTR